MVKFNLTLNNNHSFFVSVYYNILMINHVWNYYIVVWLCPLVFLL